MTEEPENMLNEEVAFNLVTINAILEYLELKFPGSKQEIYEIAQRILQEHGHSGIEPE